jgi:tetratricopeptide (TPR) repeat protein
MKLPARIIVPIVAALVLGVALTLFFSFTLRQSAAQIEKQLRTVTQELIDGGTALIGEDPGDEAGDRSLLHLRRGDLRALQGNWIEAESEYQKSVDTGGGIPALKKLAQAKLQRRDLNGVRSTIERLKESGAREEDLLLLQSILLLRTGELQEARDLLTSSPDTPQKHYGLALLAIIQGNHAEVALELPIVRSGWEPVLRSYAVILQEAYDEYAEFPESPEIHRTTLLARALAEVQECELALPLLTPVLQERDNYRDAWIVQGYCELTTERTEQALHSFERAYAIDPEKPETQFFLGRSHAALGDSNNAITFFGYAVQNGFEPSREARSLLALEAAKVGNTPLALEQYTVMIEGPDADIDTFTQYVELALGLNKKDEAYAAAKRATEKFPDEAEAWEVLGLSAADLEKKDEAREALTKALEMDPTLERARERLGRL